MQLRCRSGALAAHQRGCVHEADPDPSGRNGKEVSPDGGAKNRGGLGGHGAEQSGKAALAVGVREDPELRIGVLASSAIREAIYLCGAGKLTFARSEPPTSRLLIILDERGAFIW